MSDERWHYETSGDLDQTLRERLQGFPREPDMLVYCLRSLAALAVRSWLRIYHRLSVKGRENLPTHGSFVLVVNHTSHLDALAVIAALPLRKLHHVFPAAARDYFFVRLPRLALATIFVNALPFERKGQVRHSLQLCQQLLAQEGNILLLFPEGTRSLDGRLAEFKPGVGLLLAGTDCPVVPCHLDGADQALPKGTFWPRPRRLRLTIGKARGYSDRKRGKASALDISRELHSAIRDLAETSAAACPRDGNPASNSPRAPFAGADHDGR